MAGSHLLSDSVAYGNIWRWQDTVQVAKGVESLHETIHLLWTFNVPWHWSYPTVIEPWKAQFAFGLYGIMLTSLIVGVILTVIYRPRTWCVFCPMGNMTQVISKLKAKE